MPATLILGKSFSVFWNISLNEGAFQVIANVSTQYGGSGQYQAWMLCDAPAILYSLVKLELRDNRSVQSAAKHLAGLSFENGWPCTVSPE
jgi:hypothetical protein